MTRIRLPELGDSAIVPTTLRRAVTRVLAAMIRTHRIYAETEPLLRRLLEAGPGFTEVVDLASGAGGPWPLLLRRFSAAELTRLTLTDRFPQPDVWAAMSRVDARVNGFHEPVDACRIPPSLRGVRTIFTGLHHLDPRAVRALLDAAARDRAPFGAFELTDPETPLFEAARDSFHEARRHLGDEPDPWIRYLAPLLFAWDGALSHAHTHRLDELAALGRTASLPGYFFEAGCLEGSAPVRYLVGLPR